MDGDGPKYAEGVMQHSSGLPRQRLPWATEPLQVHGECCGAGGAAGVELGAAALEVRTAVRC